MTPIPGIVASQITGHLVTNSYESIQTVTVGSGGQASVTFSSIPSTYKHLQIRWAGSITTGGPANLWVNFNGDNGSNYTIHQLYGDGSAAGVSNSTANTNGNLGIINSSIGVGIIDLLDYTSTNKNKTGRSLGGYDNNGSGYSSMRSTVWFNTTAAITSVVIAPSSSTFTQYSSFALYGVK